MFGISTFFNLAQTVTAQVPVQAAAETVVLTSQAWTALVIFAVMYLFLVFEVIEKSLLTMIAAGLIIACGCINPANAMECINLDVLMLLIGMMTAVSIIGETGFIEWVAMLIAKKLKGNALWIMLTIFAFAMFISAFLPNATVVILLIPVVILIGQILEVPTAPLIILIAIASNIGGTATYIGDPPNTILGSKLNIGFMPFIYNLAPVAILVGLAFLAFTGLTLKRSLRVPAQIRARILNSYPELAIRNHTKMFKALFVFGAMLIAFIFSEPLGIPCGVIAIVGMSVMMVFCGEESDKMYKTVEWDTIIFFAGLFIIIGALEHNHVIDYLAVQMNAFCGGDFLFAAMFILVASAILSAFLDNIPFIIAMAPMVKTMVEQSGLGIENPQCQALIWALALGACLGGNGTLIGSSSNIIAAKMGSSSGTPISFLRFTLWGMPITAIAVVVSAFYIWVRYFVLGI